MFSFFQKCRCAIYADAIEHRVVAFSVATIGAGQVVAGGFGFGLPCMFHRATGVPCPGCGLTRSVLALLRGDVGASIGFHPLGPLLLAGMAVALLTAVMPGAARKKVIGGISGAERRVALVPVLFVMLMGIWGLRVLGMLPGLSPV